MVGLTLITGAGGVPDDVGRLVLNIYYPFMAAAMCALASALLFGRQLRRLTPPWRWTLALLWTATFLQFLADLGFGLFSSLGADHPSFDRFVHPGGPVDVLFTGAVACFALTAALMPLDQPLTLPGGGLAGDEPA